jgi:hypothetical protein
LFVERITCVASASEDNGFDRGKVKHSAFEEKIEFLVGQPGQQTLEVVIDVSRAALVVLRVDGTPEHLPGWRTREPLTVGHLLASGAPIRRCRPGNAEHTGIASGCGDCRACRDMTGSPANNATPEATASTQPYLAHSAAPRLWQRPCQLESGRTTVTTNINTSSLQPTTGRFTRTHLNCSGKKIWPGRRVVKIQQSDCPRMSGDFPPWKAEKAWTISGNAVGSETSGSISRLAKSGRYV